MYGPNIPLMFGETRTPGATGEEGPEKIVPLEAHGVRLMSIGFMLDHGSAGHHAWASDFRNPTPVPGTGGMGSPGLHDRGHASRAPEMHRSPSSRPSIWTGP